jgi:hypothetical protein
MALDAHRNWNVQMSQPFRIPLRRRSSSPMESSSMEATSDHMTPHQTPSREIFLPAEIICHIISFIPSRPSSQQILWACTLVSRVWYASSISRLYTYPHLTPANFSAFVSTICPSKNAHIRHTPLSQLVHRLDMSELVHHSSRSLTARLLGRLKGNIEEFVAPLASFAVNSFAALSKCVHLRVLDLSLVSTSIEVEQLFNTLATLGNLKTLFFPRSSIFKPCTWQEMDERRYAWPSKLQALHLAGGIDDSFLRRQLMYAPKTMERLSIQHCSQIYTGSLLQCLRTIGPQLKHLTIRHPMTKLLPSCLNQVLIFCPSLIALRISADYISHSLFKLIPPSHPLQILDLDCSPTAGANVELDPDVVFVAMEEERLPDLRSVRVNVRLAWTASKTVSRDAADLGDILEAAERERPLGVVAGVWIVND